LPFPGKDEPGWFYKFPERVDAKKVRGRSESFRDFFSQATLFYNSQSEAEKSHLTNALRFELGKVKRPEIVKRMVGILTQIDTGLAAKVAKELGIDVPPPPEPMNGSVPADGDPKKFGPKKVEQGLKKSAPLSMENTIKDTIKTRQVAVLAAEGVDGAALKAMMKTLQDKGAMVKLVVPHLGVLKTDKGELKIDESFRTTTSVLFDAVYVPGGAESIKALKAEPEAIHFIDEAYKHCKPIAVEQDGVDLLKASYIGSLLHPDGTFYNALPERVL
jgi:catalase